MTCNTAPGQDPKVLIQSVCVHVCVVSGQLLRPARPAVCEPWTHTKKGQWEREQLINEHHNDQSPDV